MPTVKKYCIYCGRELLFSEDPGFDVYICKSCREDKQSGPSNLLSENNYENVESLFDILTFNEKMSATKLISKLKVWSPASGERIEVKK